VHDAMAYGDGSGVRDFAESGEDIGKGLGLGFEDVIATKEIFADSVADVEATEIATDVVGAAFKDELLVVSGGSEEAEFE